MKKTVAIGAVALGLFCTFAPVGKLYRKAIGQPYHSEWVDPSPKSLSIDEICGKYEMDQQQFSIERKANTKKDLWLWIGPGYGQKSRSVLLEYLPQHGVWECLDLGCLVRIERKFNFDGTSSVKLKRIDDYYLELPICWSK